MSFLHAFWNIYVTIIHSILQAMGFSETGITLGTMGITIFLILSVLNSIASPKSGGFSHKSSTSRNNNLFQQHISLHKKHMNDAASESRRSAARNTVMHANQQAHRAASHAHKSGIQAHQQAHKTAVQMSSHTRRHH